MKRFLTASAILLCLSSAFARAQEVTDAESVSDFRARVSVGMDKKIAKGFHVTLSEQVRFKDKLSTFDRSKTKVGLSYKVCPYFKFGADYSYMYVKRQLTAEQVDEPTSESRHRADFYLTGMYKVGPWHFSLREMFQSTWNMRPDFNTFQKPNPAMDLRSRLKFSYAFYDKPVEPYLSCEIRNTLNAVDYTSLNTKGATIADNVKYNKVYVDRIRTALGVEWFINKRNSMDFYLLYDTGKKQKIDTNKRGKLKEVTNVPYNYFSLGIAYTFGW